jgi:F-type H+-transporting ATPase subunit c
MELLMVLLETGANLDLFAKVAAGLFAAIAAVGAGLSISKIGVAAIESIARQPEIAGDARANMIVSAALIEGLGFFAIVVCLLIVFL